MFWLWAKGSNLRQYDNWIIRLYPVLRNFVSIFKFYFYYFQQQQQKSYQIIRRNDLSSSDSFYLLMHLIIREEIKTCWSEFTVTETFLAKVCRHNWHFFLTFLFSCSFVKIYVSFTFFMSSEKFSFSWRFFF